MSEIKQMKVNEIASRHKNKHEGYEYHQRVFVPRREAKQCTVSVYEIPPKKSAYPYHFHIKNEEVFYIISGQGILKTPDGEKNVSAGDLLFFPANEKGAHKLTNSSETAMLVYIDFDTVNDIDVALYPDSKKIGIWGMDTNQVFRTEDRVDYYEGE